TTPPAAAGSPATTTPCPATGTRPWPPSERAPQPGGKRCWASTTPRSTPSGCPRTRTAATRRNPSSTSSGGSTRRSSTTAPRSPSSATSTASAACAATDPDRVRQVSRRPGAGRAPGRGHPPGAGARPARARRQAAVRGALRNAPPGRGTAAHRNTRRTGAEHRTVTTTAATTVTTTAPSGSYSHSGSYQPQYLLTWATKPCSRYPYSVAAPSEVNHVRRPGTQDRKQATSSSEQANTASVATGPYQTGAPSSCALSRW